MTMKFHCLDSRKFDRVIGEAQLANLAVDAGEPWLRGLAGDTQLMKHFLPLSVVSGGFNTVALTNRQYCIATFKYYFKN
jgi:hypothetical protein